MKIKLGQALEYEQPTKYIVASEKYKDEYKTPVLTAGKSFILGYTNETDGIYTNLPVIIFDDFTTDVKFVDFPFKVKSSAMKMLQPSSEEYNLKFFYYLMKFMNFRPTSHQRHWISKFAEFEFDIPAREKQDEIVEKLDKLCEMLALKEKELKKYDDLVKSQFIEMFGTLSNMKKSEHKMSDVLVVNPKKETLDDSQIVTFIPMEKVGVDGGIDTTRTRIYGEVKKGFSQVKENDILFAKITPCMENGKSTIARNLCNGYGNCTTELIVLRCKEQVVPEYIFNIVHTKEFRIEAEKSMTGSAGQKRVPKSFIEEYPIFIPPIELQNQFADFVKHIDKLKFTIKQSIEKLNLCYQSLMKEYFE